jgi:hypothetical protein
MLWGSLGSKPTHGHQAGSPSVIQQVMKTPEAEAYKVEQQRKLEEQKMIQKAE